MLALFDLPITVPLVEADTLLPIDRDPLDAVELVPITVAPKLEVELLPILVELFDGEDLPILTPFALAL